MIWRTLFCASLLFVVGCGKDDSALGDDHVPGHDHDHDHEHGHDHDHDHDHGAAVGDATKVATASAVCPPCRMTVQPHFETFEAAGLRFSVCNPRCKEIVEKDPKSFAADALQ